MFRAGVSCNLDNYTQKQGQNFDSLIRNCTYKTYVRNFPFSKAHTVIQKQTITASIFMRFQL